MARRAGYRTCLCPALRRVDAVRVTRTGQGATAEVIGVGHRHPISVRVSLALAARLVADGAPLTTRHHVSAGAPAAPGGSTGSAG